MKASPIALALALLIVACGDAVTNPSLQGFDADPRVIQGDWATILLADDGERRFDARLDPAGGVFIGQFDLFQGGRDIRLQFNDGQWDGIELRFVAQTPLRDGPQMVEWQAIYIPDDGNAPDRLVLRTQILAPLSFEYVRPRHLPTN